MTYTSVSDSSLTVSTIVSPAVSQNYSRLIVPDNRPRSDIFFINSTVLNTSLFYEVPCVEIAGTYTIGLGIS